MPGSITALEERLDSLGMGKIATIMGVTCHGQDNRWERTEMAYRVLVYGEGERAESA